MLPRVRGETHIWFWSVGVHLASLFWHTAHNSSRMWLQTKAEDPRQAGESFVYLLTGAPAPSSALFVLPHKTVSQSRCENTTPNSAHLSSGTSPALHSKDFLTGLSDEEKAESHGWCFFTYHNDFFIYSVWNRGHFWTCLEQDTQDIPLQLRATNVLLCRYESKH